jgi:hypothetical protein
MLAKSGKKIRSVAQESGSGVLVKVDSGLQAVVGDESKCYRREGAG